MNRKQKRFKNKLERYQGSKSLALNYSEGRNKWYGLLRGKGMYSYNSVNNYNLLNKDSRLTHLVANKKYLRMVK